MEKIAEAGRVVKADDPNMREIKEVLRRLTYGLYAVTVKVGAESGGMTANWISQCSASPPMLMIAMETDSHTLALVRRSDRFFVSLYEESQRSLAARISKPSARTPEKLDAVAFVETPAGIPVPAGTLAWLECVLRSEVPSGDHVIVTAEVVRTGGSQPGVALTLLASGFRYG
jgi:3-hydroxy-9,10-secoandrosta-1,3,5(10)-triene-9,17-dione monooxygenase reductase component